MRSPESQGAPASATQGGRGASYLTESQFTHLWSGHHNRTTFSVLSWDLSIQSVQFSCSVVSNSLWPHVLQHTRLPCPSPNPKACSSSCPSRGWCHPTISSSVVPFSSCLQSFPVPGSFPMSQLFTSGGQSTGASASASVLSVNIQYWFPLRLTGLISFKSLVQHYSSKVSTAAAAKSLQSCLTLCDPIDSSSPGSSVPGILQARAPGKALEWVAISFSRAHYEDYLKN